MSTVGMGNLVTGNDIPGVNIVDVAKCVVGWFSTMHDLGARNFLFINVRPKSYNGTYPDTRHE